MTSAALNALLSGRPDVQVFRDGNYIEVYKRGLHSGRYIINQGVFWFETTETRQRYDEKRAKLEAECGFAPAILPSAVGIEDIWPPRCYECGAPMVTRNGEYGWFFACSECVASAPLTPHPDDRIKPARRHGFGWSPEACKAHEKTLAREAWESGLARTIERRLNGNKKSK